MKQHDENEIVRLCGEVKLATMDPTEILMAGYTLGYGEGFADGVVKWATDQAPVKASFPTEPEINATPARTSDKASSGEGMVEKGDSYV